MASLKEQKEEFVMGFEGTSAEELLIICSTIPIGLWCYQSLATSVRWKSALVEALSFPIPMILCQSNLLYPWGVGYLVLQLLLGLIFSTNSSSAGAASTDPRRTAITIYRSAMLFLTFVAILAVDFRVFPRRFVKTEVRGYSLMDLGAASFVVAAGIVSPRARGKRASPLNFLRLLPVVGMGLLRLATIKGLEYQEHASEYGVHWNFFFTLAMLAPIASFLPGPTWIVPTAIMAIYQYLLSQYGLQEWVEDAPRSCVERDTALCHLFAANREGILGCIGYAALFLMSEFIAHRCIWSQSGNSSTISWATLAVFLVWRLLVDVVGLDVSRRTTNAVFCVWTLFVSCLQLTAIGYILQRRDLSVTPPPVFEAINKHGMMVFVIANLLTGLVNISINTLEVSDGMALGILAIYMSAISVVAIALEYVLGRFEKRPKQN
jgi:phosphatidylinositol glycan class W